MQLLYPTFLRGPALQRGGLHRVRLSCCTLYVVLRVLHGGPNSRVAGKYVCDALLSGAHTHRVHFTFFQAKATGAWLLLSTDFVAPTGVPRARQMPLVSLEEWAFSCWPLGRSPGVGQRGAQVSERTVHPDLAWSDMCFLQSVCIACQSLNHCP